MQALVKKFSCPSQRSLSFLISIIQLFMCERFLTFSILFQGGFAPLRFLTCQPWPQVVPLDQLYMCVELSDPKLCICYFGVGGSQFLSLGSGNLIFLFRPETEIEELWYFILRIKKNLWYFLSRVRGPVIFVIKN